MSIRSTQQTLDSTEKITIYQVTKTEITLNPLYQTNEPFILPRVNSYLMGPDPAFETNRQFVFPGYFSVSGLEILPASVTSGGMDFEDKSDRGRRRSLPNFRSIPNLLYSRRSSSSSIKTSKSEPMLPSSLSRRSSPATLRSRFSSRSSSIASTTTTQSEPIIPSVQSERKLSLQEFFNTEREDERRKSAPDVLCGNNLQDSHSSRIPGEILSVTQRLRIIRRRARKCEKEEKEGEDAGPVWTEKYGLDLPYHIQRDKSELDFLQRRNKLAAAGVMAIDDDEDKVVVDAPVYKVVITRH